MFILPSRGRPQRFKRFFELWQKNTSQEFRWLLVLDKDDPMLGHYPHPKEPWEIIVQTRESMGDTYNGLFDLNRNEEFYGFMADDIELETPGWDEILVSLASNDGLSFGDDGINGERLASHPVIGGDFVREIGWLSPPGLRRIYIDTAWTELARRHAVLRYCPSVVTRHVHFSTGSAEIDSTYDKPEKSPDKEIYKAWLSSLSA